MLVLRIVITCSEKDYNCLSFLYREREERNIMNILRNMFRPLGSALSCGCINAFSSVITWSKEKMPYAFLKTIPLIFAFFGFVAFYYIFNLFTHSFFKKYLDPVQVFLSMKRRDIVEHGKLISKCQHST